MREKYFSCFRSRSTTNKTPTIVGQPRIEGLAHFNKRFGIASLCTLCFFLIEFSFAPSLLFVLWIFADSPRLIMKLQILYFESLSENTINSPSKAQRNPRLSHAKSISTVKTPLRPISSNIDPPTKHAVTNKQILSPRLDSPISFKMPQTPARSLTVVSNGVTVTTVPTKKSSTLCDHDTLLEAYAEKRRLVNLHEKQMELAKFELLEISVQIEENIRQQHIEQARLNGSADIKIYQQAAVLATEKMRLLDKAAATLKQGTLPLDAIFPAITSLTKKASTIFRNNNLDGQSRPFDASTLFGAENGQLSRFGASTILDPLKERASDIFQQPHENKDIQAFISTSNHHIDRLSHKTSQFFSLVMDNISPSKSRQRSSLDYDGNTSINDCSWLNLPQPPAHEPDFLDHSLLLSDGEVDIDDCDSTF